MIENLIGFKLSKFYRINTPDAKGGQFDGLEFSTIKEAKAFMDRCNRDIAEIRKKERG